MAQATALRWRGQLIPGTLFDRWTDTDSDGDRLYCVAYRFTPPSGPQMTKAEYNRAAYDAFASGASISVRYLPNKPRVSRLEL